jgi:DNA invertase Pin-like site-specific DNA recombinase
MQSAKNYAVAYVRVSTAGQADEGVSLDAQRAKLEAWAQANGYELLAVHSDAGISGGKTENRPGLQAALSQACEKRAALVVYSLSRLARSTKDAITISEQLDRSGADLVSLTEKIDTTNAAGKMIFRMMAVLAEFERDLIRERTSAALQHMSRVKQQRVGEVRFGFDLAADGKTLLRNEREQATLVKIKLLRERKHASFGKIAHILNSLGIAAKQGGVWSKKTVWSIYKGLTA